MLKEEGVSSGCSMEKALRCLMPGEEVDVCIPPASLSSCEMVLKSCRDLWCRGQSLSCSWRA